MYPINQITEGDVHNELKNDIAFSFSCQDHSNWDRYQKKPKALLEVTISLILGNSFISQCNIPRRSLWAALFVSLLYILQPFIMSFHTLLPLADCC